MDNRAGEMQVILRAVGAGNFSAATRLLRMTPSTVSKLITRSETRLDVRRVERRKTVASLACLEHHGMPHTIEDLARHDRQQHGRRHGPL